MADPIERKRARLADVRPEERRAFFLSAALFFCVMFSYYLVRGLRDELGIRQGLENLDELWQWTAVIALLMHPVVGFAVSRLPRRIFIPLAFRLAFVGVLLTFYLLTSHRPADGETPDATWLLAARTFYVAVSLWVMLATSLFWSLMADVWTADQGKRLFGLVATGASLGAIGGSGMLYVTAFWTRPTYALLLCAVLLEVCARLGRAVVRHADASPSGRSGGRERAGGNPLSGFFEVLRSPYLLALAAFLLVLTLGNGFLYLQTSAVLRDELADRAARTRVFAAMDFSTSALALVLQGWLAARVARRFGAWLLLAAVPLIAFGGFLTLAALPIVAVVFAFNVAMRAGRYALTRPGRALLFTVVPQRERYKAQNFLDVSLYRAGDYGTAELYGAAVPHALPGVPAGVPSTALLVAPATLIGAFLALRLGRRFEARAKSSGE